MKSAREPGKVTWVEVPAASLAVQVSSQNAQPVLAIHRTSSQRTLWNWLRATAGLIAEAREVS